MKSFLALVIVLVSSGVTNTAADKEALSRLVKAQSLKCEFGAGVNAEWKNGVLTLGAGRLGHQAPRARFTTTALTSPLERRE